MRVTAAPVRLTPAVGFDQPGRLGAYHGPQQSPFRSGGGIKLETLKRWAKSWWLAWVALVGTLAYSLDIAVVTRETDLLVYLMGGRLAFTPALYTSTLTKAALPFTYTPFAALIFSPFGWAALGPARIPTQVIWTLINVVILLGLLSVSIRAIRPEIAPKERWRLALLLSFPAVFLDPVLLTVGFGQINLLLALMVLWDLLGDRRIGSRQLPLGVATGIAVAIKLTPAIFIPFMFMTGRRRGALNCVVTFLACEVLGFVLSPSASWLFWTKDVFKPSRTGGLLYLSDQNLSSAIQRIHHAPLATGVLAPVVLAIGVGGLILAVWAHRRSSSVLGVIVCATTGLIVSPVTWTHHLVWIVPALIWLAAAPDAPRQGRKIAAAVAIFFWAAPIWWVPRDAIHALQWRGWQIVAGNSFLIAMLAFLLGVMLLMIRREWGTRRGRLRVSRQVPVPPVPPVRLATGSLPASPLPSSSEGRQARTSSVP